jgi:large subunit ribosomal protein L21
MATAKTTKKVPKAKNEESSGEFAVILAGGKQYKVSVGDVVTLEKITGDFKMGDKITFDKVLLVDNGKDTSIGMPYIDGAKVEATFQESGKGKKVTVMKYKPKSRYKKTNGHRQPFTKVKIMAIK